MSHKHFLHAIASFVSKTSEVREKAEDLLKVTSSQSFLETKLGTLLGVIEAYSILYTQANVPNRKTLEKQLSRLYRIPEVQDALNALLDCEKLWNQFLTKLDQDVALGVSQGPRLQPGDPLPPDIDVIDARTGLSEDFSSVLPFNDCTKKCLVVLLRHFA
ncbi:unnamed protein product [Clavelina lepadiformis]|uniref:Uncharacterized protein n=1 Tax=Clavelina lepadiformis TaxID=159417 RepID=A0ABP0FNY4_CLALP